MQNTFSQSGNDSKWFSKKTFLRIGMWHSRPPRDPPPLHGKYHLKFPFWLSAPLPYDYSFVHFDRHHIDCSSSELIALSRKKYLNPSPAWMSRQNPNARWATVISRRVKYFVTHFHGNLPQRLWCAPWPQSRKVGTSWDCTPSTLLYQSLCWTDAETGHHCTPGSRLWILNWGRRECE